MAWTTCFILPCLYDGLEWGIYPVCPPCVLLKAGKGVSFFPRCILAIFSLFLTFRGAPTEQALLHDLRYTEPETP